jgi:hypothetical protein
MGAEGTIRAMFDIQNAALDTGVSLVDTTATRGRGALQQWADATRQAQRARLPAWHPGDRAGLYGDRPRDHAPALAQPFSCGRGPDSELRGVPWAVTARADRDGTGLASRPNRPLHVRRWTAARARGGPPDLAGWPSPVQVAWPMRFASPMADTEAACAGPAGRTPTTQGFLRGPPPTAAVLSGGRERALMVAGIGHLNMATLAR